MGLKYSAAAYLNGPISLKLIMVMGCCTKHRYKVIKDVFPTEWDTKNEGKSKIQEKITVVWFYGLQKYIEKYIKLYIF